MNANITSSSESQNQTLPLEGASESPVPAVNQSRDGSTGTPDGPEPKAPRCAEGALQLSIHDYHGDPIANLKFKVFVEKKEFFSGQTDARGEAPAIEGFTIGSVFEIRVRRDAGDYKFAALGKIESEENIACLKSPKTRFEFATVAHQGAPGGAEAHKATTISRHNQKPAEVPNMSRNPDERPMAKDDRNAKGHPKAVVAVGRKNICGTNVKGGESPNANKSEMEKVKALIDFATEQASRIHPDGLTAQAVIEQMQGGCDQSAGVKTPFGFENSIKRCAKYVKIALWWAGYSHNNGDITKGVGLAKDMGPSLLAAGFKDVTAQLPDARWAAPGDIIVYQRINDPNAAGHVDIRTYDGYLSDFLETYLPYSKFRVTGIYRKYFDPLPELRMRAFLKVIRSREAETVMKKHGDASTYRALPLSEKIGLMFDGFDTHPFEGKKVGNSSASGAYGIKLATFNGYTISNPKKLPHPPVPILEHAPKFNPTIQDRIAVAIMELHLGQGYLRNNGVTELGLIRKGEIEKAANLLATRSPHQWTSLPGGIESSYSVAAMMSDYNKFLTELISK